MTASAVGARSGDPERARFIRALLASLLLHGLILVLKIGPASGVNGPPQRGGGMIEAVLRRAPPAATLAEQAAEATLQPAPVATPPEALKPPIAADVAPSPVEVANPPRSAASAPVAPSGATGPRDEGGDAAPGNTATGSESLSIPLLPPLSITERQVPGRAALLAPLNFSYPPNVRIQSGRVRVRILLDEKGQVEEMRVDAAVPPGFFDLAAIQVLRAGRFRPGFVGPIQVRSYLFMEVTFGPGPQGQQIGYAGSTFAPPSNRR